MAITIDGARFLHGVLPKSDLRGVKRVRNGEENGEGRL